MDLDSSVRLGLTIGGPLSSLIGAGLAVGVTASPYVNIWSKALGAPISIVVGLFVGSHLSASITPGLGGFGTALFFGHGFLMCWALAATLGHDDTAYNASRLMSWAWPLLKKLFRRLKTGKNPPRLNVPPITETLKRFQKKRP